jgi:hypothetical protein
MRTDGHDKVNSCFSQFGNATKNQQRSIARRAPESRNTDYSKIKFSECQSDSMSEFQCFKYTDVWQQKKALSEITFMGHK